MSDDKRLLLREIKQSIAEPFVNTIWTSLILSLMVAIISRNYFWFTFTLAMSLLMFALYYFLTYKTFYLSKEGILVKSRLGQNSVNWKEIISMSTVYTPLSFLRYQIKTKDRTLSLPVPNNWQKFEEIVVREAGLEPAGENMALLFKIDSPGIKRWKKEAKSM